MYMFFLLIYICSEIVSPLAKIYFSRCKVLPNYNLICTCLVMLSIFISYPFVVFFREVSFQILGTFLIELSFYCWVLRFLQLLESGLLPAMLFSSFGFSLSFFDRVLWRTKTYNFDDVQYISYFLLFSLVSYLRNCCLIQAHDDSLCFPKSFIVLVLILRSMNHLS